MEATTTRPGTYHPLGFGAAVGEQLRLLWLSRRPLLLLVGLLGLLALSGEPWSDDPAARLFTLWPLWVVVLPGIWAFTVWHNEGPSNRLYFWSQPVSRVTHSLARVAAGLLWLLGLYALLVAAGALFAALEGELAQFARVDFAGWVCFFTGPTIAYLAVTVLTLPSDYPIRWFLALLFGIPLLLSVVDEWLGMEGLVRAILRPVGAEWGLGPTLVGPLLLSMARLQQMLLGHSGPDVPDEIFDLSTWWISMPLWLLLFGGAVVYLATRHPDSRPSLRRRS